MTRFVDHFYIISTIFLAVYSQLIMRWQVSIAGELPEDLRGKVVFVVELFFNPWIISCIVATLFAGVSWMLVMTRFEISYAYPWVSLSFVLMLILGVFLFGEEFSVNKLVGTIVVVFGIIIITRG